GHISFPVGTVVLGGDDGEPLPVGQDHDQPRRVAPVGADIGGEGAVHVHPHNGVWGQRHVWGRGDAGDRDGDRSVSTRAALVQVKRDPAEPLPCRPRGGEPGGGVPVAPVGDVHVTGGGRV